MTAEQVERAERYGERRWQMVLAIAVAAILGGADVATSLADAASQGWK